MKLESIFDEISKAMLSEFEKTRAAIGSNPSLKGTAFENTVKKFLRDHLPSSLDVTTGLVVDSFGNKSRQIDIIITDAAKTPIFYHSEELRVVPIECVYAAIEIKARLTAEELDHAFQNMKSLKSLVKRAYLLEDGPLEYKVKMYGKKFDIWPVNYYLFALDSIELIHVAQALTDIYNAEQSLIQDRIDTICVLNKGVIANDINGALSVTPEAPAKVAVLETNRALLCFYGLICTNLLHAQLPTIDLNPYINGIKW